MAGTHSPDAPEIDVDVFIVGTGPTGGTAALALASYGVRVHAITRFGWLSNSPRAHITNQRTMEVFRDLGVARDILKQAAPWERMGDTLFTTSFAGPEIARIRAWGTGDERHGDYVRASPEGLVDIPQPVMESVLVNAAAERGATFSFNTEYLGHQQDDDGVTVRLRDRLSSREYSARARYLIGADGASSKVLDDLGLPLTGQMGRGSTAYVQFTADLSHYVEHRPSILYWIVSPSTSFGEIGLGLLRAVRPWDRWIAGWGYDPAVGAPDFSHDSLVHRIRALVGDPGLEPEVTATSTWQVNESHATEYSRGRVFCAGDAVHRHPPSNGLGSNTSVQDAYNLAWKLATVLRGEAHPALLQSYSEERVPVGQQIVARANRSRLDFGAVNQALRGQSAPGAAESVLTRVSDPGPEGVAVRSALRSAIEGKNYEFNAHGVELNQRYRSVAVLGAVLGAPDDAEPFERDAELFAQPSVAPGAKLPHAWLVGRDGRRLSTLDLVGAGRWSVVTGLGGGLWAAASRSVERLPLRTVVIGDDGARDLYFDWARVSDLPETGALLVRPDGYIAWAHPGPAHDDAHAASELLGALETLLGARPLGARPFGARP